jgi:predicted nucleotidyltransferase
VNSDKLISFNFIKETAESVLVNRFRFVLLLGSAATERFNINSDIDLGVYFNVKCTYDELARLRGQLELIFDRECDLVQLNEVDLIFSRQVIETGRELAMADRSFFNIWRAEQLSRYPDFKISRKIIEDNLLRRKKYV